MRRQNRGCDLIFLLLLLAVTGWFFAPSRAVHPRLLFWAFGGDLRLVEIPGPPGRYGAESVGPSGSGLWMADPEQNSCRFVLPDSDQIAYPRLSFRCAELAATGYTFYLQDLSNYPEHDDSLNLQVVGGTVTCRPGPEPKGTEWRGHAVPNSQATFLAAAGQTSFWQFPVRPDFFGSPHLEILAWRPDSDERVLLNPKFHIIYEWTSRVLEDDQQWESFLSAAMTVRRWSKSYVPTRRR